MAKTEQEMKGRVGNTVFYRVGGETRVRGLATGYQDPKSEGQQASRSRLRVATRFYQNLVETPLREVWRAATKNSGRNSFNFFLKRNIHVFNGNGKIDDFSRLQLTVGLLQPVNNLGKQVDEGDRVRLSWVDNSQGPSARAEDRLRVVVLYANRAFSPWFAGEVQARRGDGEAAFALQRKPGTAAHVYCFFEAADGGVFSNSQYLRV